MLWARWWGGHKTPFRFKSTYLPLLFGDFWVIGKPWGRVLALWCTNQNWSVGKNPPSLGSEPEGHVAGNPNTTGAEDAGTVKEPLKYHHVSPRRPPPASRIPHGKLSSPVFIFQSPAWDGSDCPPQYCLLGAKRNAFFRPTGEHSHLKICC